jgi:hypothetical protein
MTTLGQKLQFSASPFGLGETRPYRPGFSPEIVGKPAKPKKSRQFPGNPGNNRQKQTIEGRMGLWIEGLANNRSAAQSKKHEPDKGEQSAGEAVMTARVTENDVADAIRTIAAYNADKICSLALAFSDIPLWLDLSAADKAPSPSRPSEPLWHQLVRNIWSHRNEPGNFIKEGLLVHVEGVGYALPAKAPEPTPPPPPPPPVPVPVPVNGHAVQVIRPRLSIEGYKGLLSAPYFQDERLATDVLEMIVWPDGQPACITCGTVSQSGRMSTGSGAETVRWCVRCGKPFTLTMRTIMHRTRLPMHRWLQVFRLSVEDVTGRDIYQVTTIMCQSAVRALNIARDATAPDGRIEIKKGVFIDPLHIDPTEISF